MKLFFQKEHNVIKRKWERNKYFLSKKEHKVIKRKEKRNNPILKGHSEIIAVTTPSISIKSEIFAFW